MKYYIILISLVALVVIFFLEKQQKRNNTVDVPKNISIKQSSTIKAPKKMTVKEKKERFEKLFVAPVTNVYMELMQKYSKAVIDIKEGKNQGELQALKKLYRANSDDDLLLRLKPHPISIVLAQAAIESTWGTSRFFREAKNPFGMWSTNPNEPRIAAGEKRAEKKTVWLKKFTTLDDAIRAYYKTIAIGEAYKKFRQLRFKYNDPYKITPGLDKYSEMGEKYVKEINEVIRYNKFTRFDKTQ